MSLIDWIGFIIALGALTILYFRKVKEERDRSAHPQIAEQQIEAERAHLREMLSMLDRELVDLKGEEKPKAAQVKMPPLKKKAHHIPRVEHKAVDSAYAIKEELSSRGVALISHLSSKNEMVLYREIFGPPKALSKDERLF